MGGGGGVVSKGAGGETRYIILNMGLYRAEGCHSSGNDHGKVRKFYFESGKIDILKKSQGKLK